MQFIGSGTQASYWQRNLTGSLFFTEQDERVKWNYALHWRRKQRRSEKEVKAKEKDHQKEGGGGGRGKKMKESAVLVAVKCDDYTVRAAVHTGKTDAMGE